MGIVTDIDFIERLGYTWLRILDHKEDAEAYVKEYPGQLVVHVVNPKGEDWWDVYKKLPVKE